MDVVEKMAMDITHWFGKQGWDNLAAECDAEFEYSPDEHIIYFPILTQDSIDGYFAQFMYEYGLAWTDIPMYIVSIIHEVGHYFTLDNFSNEEWLEYLYHQENTIPEMPQGFDRNYTYWELPVEFAANMWAINWMNEHRGALLELTIMLEKDLGDIYADDEIIAAYADYIE